MTACYIWGKWFPKKFGKSKNYRKVTEHCHFPGKYRSAPHSKFNLRFNVPNKIPVVFHNGSNCGNHFIIEKLAKVFEGQFECLRENAKKCKTFSIPTEKEVRKVYEDNNDIVIISHKIKFLNSPKFMARLLSNFVNNLAGWIHKIN